MDIKLSFRVIRGQIVPVLLVLFSGFALSLTVPEQAPSDMNFNETLNLLYDGYFVAQTALAKDDFYQTKSALYAMRIIIQATENKDFGLDSSASEKWDDLLQSLVKTTEKAQNWSSITVARKAFESVSRTMLSLENQFGYSSNYTIYEVYCPMALGNRGATWLQQDEIINNPYLGVTMPRCGEVRREIKPNVHNRP